MYSETKSIEEVLKYLYEAKQDKLAEAVLKLIRQCERAEAQTKSASPNTPVTILTSNPITPWQPPVWYDV